MGNGFVGLPVYWKGSYKIRLMHTSLCMSVRDALFLELAVRIFLKIDMKLEDDKWKKATGPDFLEQAYAYDKSA